MDYKIIIKTNHQYRPFKYRDEVPAKVLAGQYSHLSEDMDGFFCYKNYWYHVSDFMPCPNSDGKWDGYVSDSFFSGVLIKIDGDSVMTATYFS